ncbi:MAG: CPBP family intramembrane metalloprotease [Alphaproteobacteria bacterium]|nr:CPBP family intramembrane metalloprotease [Alphaproteobacteria bacterium]
MAKRIALLGEPDLHQWLVWDYLFVGLWLVAICEELVFRRFLFALLERMGMGRFVVLLASSAIFGIIHITSGLNAAVSALLHGLILGTVFYVTRRLSLCIVLHYVDDFLIFGGNAVNDGMWSAAAS